MMSFKNAFISALALLPLGCWAPEPSVTDDALSAIEESQLKDKAKSRNNKFLTYYYNGISWKTRTTISEPYPLINEQNAV